MAGGVGSIVLWDWRSHRLKRVGNSSSVVETYALDEMVDAAQLLRGVLAELRGHPMDKAHAADSLESSNFTAVVDAKDTHDKVTMDTSSLGSRRSLGFTVAWLKQQFRGRGISLRWTATPNMLADCLTKDMPSDQLVDALRRRTWAITYVADFVRNKGGKKRAAPVIDKTLLPGQEVAADDAVRRVLTRLVDKPGWHLLQGVPVQVARSAKAFRTSEPRHASSLFPRRTTFGGFSTAAGGLVWRSLERRAAYLDLPNQHAKIGSVAATLITFFEPEGTKFDTPASKL